MWDFILIILAIAVVVLVTLYFRQIWAGVLTVARWIEDRRG